MVTNGWRDWVQQRLSIILVFVSVGGLCVSVLLISLNRVVLGGGLAMLAILAAAFACYRGSCMRGSPPSIKEAVGVALLYAVACSAPLYYFMSIILHAMGEAGIAVDFSAFRWGILFIAVGTFVAVLVSELKVRAKFASRKVERR